MVHRDMNIQHVTTEKLNENLQNINGNYKHEKTVTQAKNVKIRLLEKILLELSSNLRDVKYSKKLL